MLLSLKLKERKQLPLRIKHKHNKQMWLEMSLYEAERKCEIVLSCKGSSEFERSLGELKELRRYVIPELVPLEILEIRKKTPGAFVKNGCSVLLSPTGPQAVAASRCESRQASSFPSAVSQKTPTC